MKRWSFCKEMVKGPGYFWEEFVKVMLSGPVSDLTPS